MAKIFKALSNEQRLKLFSLIYQWYESGRISDQNACCGVEKSFTKACNSLGLSKSTVSHHIKELENAGLITISRNGKCCFCIVNDDAVQLIRKFLI